MPGASERVCHQKTGCACAMAGFGWYWVGSDVHMMPLQALSFFGGVVVCLWCEVLRIRGAFAKWLDPAGCSWDLLRVPSELLRGSGVPERVPGSADLRSVCGAFRGVSERVRPVSLILRYNAQITTKQGVKLCIAGDCFSVRSLIVLTRFQPYKALQTIILQR